MKMSVHSYLIAKYGYWTPYDSGDKSDIQKLFFWKKQDIQKLCSLVLGRWSDHQEIWGEINFQPPTLGNQRRPDGSRHTLGSLSFPINSKEAWVLKAGDEGSASTHESWVGRRFFIGKGQHRRWMKGCSLKTPWFFLGGVLDDFCVFLFRNI